MDRLLVACAPFRHHAGKAEQRAVISVYIVWALAANDRLPFVPARGGNETPGLAVGVAPQRFGRDVLGARVESACRRLRLAPPVRDEAPARDQQLASAPDH